MPTEEHIMVQQNHKHKTIPPPPKLFETSASHTCSLSHFLHEDTLSSSVVPRPNCANTCKQEQTFSASNSPSVRPLVQVVRVQAGHVHCDGLVKVFQDLDGCFSGPVLKRTRQQRCCSCSSRGFFNVMAGIARLWHLALT